MTTERQMGDAGADCPYALKGKLGYSNVPPVQLLLDRHPMGWPMIAVAPPPAGKVKDANDAGIAGWVQVLGCAPDQVEEALNNMFKARLTVGSSGVVQVEWSFDAAYIKHHLRNDLLKDVRIRERQESEVTVNRGTCAFVDQMRRRG